MRYMPLRNASTTSPSSSIFSSLPSAIHPPPNAPLALGARAERRLGRLRDDRHVRRLRAFRSLARLEFNLGAFGERLEAAAADLRVVDEQVLAVLFGRDEPVALCIVEPLHGSGCHGKTPPLPIHERVGEVLSTTGTRSRVRRAV